MSNRLLLAGDAWGVPGEGDLPFLGLGDNGAVPLVENMAKSTKNRKFCKEGVRTSSETLKNGFPTLKIGGGPLTSQNPISGPHTASGRFWGAQTPPPLRKLHIYVYVAYESFAPPPPPPTPVYPPPPPKGPRAPLVPFVLLRGFLAQNMFPCAQVNGVSIAFFVEGGLWSPSQILALCVYNMHAVSTISILYLLGAHRVYKLHTAI